MAVLLCPLLRQRLRPGLPTKLFLQTVHEDKCAHGFDLVILSELNIEGPGFSKLTIGMALGTTQGS